MQPALVSLTLSNLKERFSVELVDGSTLLVSDQAFREYRVERDASCVATIVKAPTGVRDSYDIEVTRGSCYRHCHRRAPDGATQKRLSLTHR